MKLSLSNGILASYPLAENIAALKKLGFTNLEFNMKCVEEEDEKAAYSAKKLIETHELNCLTLHSATLPVKNETEIPKAIYYVKVSADFASKLSAPVMVIHSNVARKLPEKTRKKFLMRIFGELNPHAKRLGVRLALENLSNASKSYGSNPAELEEVLDIIDGDVGVTLDFCHAETTEQTLSLLETYGNRLLNVHVSNRQHQPFNRETKALKGFFAKLREYEYSGPLTIELNPKCTTEMILQTKVIIENILDKV